MEYKFLCFPGFFKTADDVDSWDEKMTLSNFRKGISITITKMTEMAKTDTITPIEIINRFKGVAYMGVRKFDA